MPFLDNGILPGSQPGVPGFETQLCHFPQIGWLAGWLAGWLVGWSAAGLASLSGTVAIVPQHTKAPHRASPKW